MTAPLLDVRRIAAGYVRGMPIVHDVSLRVAAGEVVAIIGPNGAGKSTFLKALAGLVHREAGTMTLSGQDVTGLAAHEVVRAGMGFVPQTGNVFTTLTIHENLALGGHTLSGAVLHARRTEMYDRFPVLAQRRGASARVLSGGQRQVLAVARALMTAPALLMLDEPTAGLAPRVVEEVLADLKRLAGTGVAVLLVEQNAKAALRRADRAYVLTEGRVHSTGRAADLLDDPAMGEAFLGGRRDQGGRRRTT